MIVKFLLACVVIGFKETCVCVTVIAPTLSTAVEKSATSAATSAATSTATSAATTAKLLNPEQHDYLVYNTSCVLLASEMQWSIPYTDMNGTLKTAKIGIQSPMSYSAICNESAFENVLSISLFNATWNMSITFGGNSTKFWWKNLSLSYVLDEGLFHEINQTEARSVHNFTYSFHMFDAQINGSYLCNSLTTTSLSDGYSYSIWKLQYTALQKNVTAFSSQHVTQCADDIKTNTIVPIAVGAALAGLVVIVLIAYLIGRRRNRKGYESV